MAEVCMMILTLAFLSGCSSGEPAVYVVQVDDGVVAELETFRVTINPKTGEVRYLASVVVYDPDGMDRHRAYLTHSNGSIVGRFDFENGKGRPIGTHHFDSRDDGAAAWFAVEHILSEPPSALTGALGPNGAGVFLDLPSVAVGNL